MLDDHQHEKKTMQILQGLASALFAFDIGYEVSLEKLSGLLPSTPIHPLSGKKRTPSFLRYARSPRTVNLGATEGLLAGPGQIQATIFDFGVVSIAYNWPLTSGE